MRALVIIAFAIEVLSQPARAETDVDARQKTCEQRGAEQFERRFESARRKENNYVATYSNHFNTKSQKCFSVQVKVHYETIGSASSSSVEYLVLDIDERRIYGMLSEDRCQIASVSCTSKLEWERTVSLLMQE